MNKMNNICFGLFHIFIIFKFCKSSCEDDWPKCRNGNTNVVCERGGDCSARPGCFIIDVDENFRRWVVDEHNKLRSKVAQGDETRGGNSAAADMMVLSYDVEMEYTAKCNVNYCTYEHDGCRRSKKHKTAGQNLFKAWGIPFDFDKANVVFNEAEVRRAINLWYDEAKDTTEAVLNSYGSPTSAKIGHFTQMVWAKTTRVGCVRANDAKTYYLVCNYAEAGNVRTQPVYTRGNACSKCPNGVSCNTKYKGLCGEVDESEFTRSPLKVGRISVSYYVSLGLPLVLVFFKFWHVLY